MAKRRLTGKTLAALTPYPTSSAPPQREDEDAVLPCRSDNVLLESRGSNDDVVDVRGVLLDALRCEVALEVASASAGLNSAAHGQAFPCPRCPFHRMARETSLVTHLQKSHNEGNQFVASGTKQKRLAVALFDADMLAGREPMDLLARSASLLRDTVAPPLPSCTTRIDKSIRLMLTARGPEYVNAQVLGNNVLVRRVANLYYTRDFANLLFREMMMSKGRLQEALTRVQLHFGLVGSELGNMLPGHSKIMWKIVQDVFRCDPIRTMRSAFFEQVQEADEFETLSMDGTIKVALSIMGQTPATLDARARAEAAYSEEEHLRKVVSVVGRTGCLLALRMVREESAEHLAAEGRSWFTEEQRSRVRFIGCDNPSASLFDALKKTFPNLEVLVLDATHLAMNYEKCSGGKSSPGSKALRRVLSKFAALGPDRDFGAAFVGGAAAELSATEVSLRETILGQGDAVDPADAQAFLDNLSADTPFQSREEFIRALACVAVCYRGEMRRKSHKGRHVCSLLASAAQPAKCAWLFNNHLHRHSMQRSRVSLLPSGTTSNEALHNELKVAFRQTVRVHQATMATKLSIFHLGKMMVHTLASFRPTSRQMLPSHIRARALSQDAITAEAWESLCECREGRKPLTKAVPGLHKWHRVNVARVRAWLGLQRTCKVDRPRKKRTVFTLDRRGPCCPTLDVATR